MQNLIKNILTDLFATERNKNFNHLYLVSIYLISTFLESLRGQVLKAVTYPPHIREENGTHMAPLPSKESFGHRPGFNSYFCLDPRAHAILLPFRASARRSTVHVTVMRTSVYVKVIL